jgi:predicted nucleic acid-binding protein
MGRAQGERGFDLAVHVLTAWLVERNVAVIHIPDLIFERAKRKFETSRTINCDFTDVLSYEIIRGLQQDRIISPDGHFRTLGLTCYPTY